MMVAGYSDERTYLLFRLAHAPVVGTSGWRCSIG
jgi:hypothetical protein